MLTDWTPINADQMCCNAHMEPIHHEAQPMADQCKRTYQCNMCTKIKIIRVDMHDMSWDVWDGGRIYE